MLPFCWLLDCEAASEFWCLLLTQQCWRHSLTVFLNKCVTFGSTQQLSTVTSEILVALVSTGRGPRWWREIVAYLGKIPRGLTDEGVSWLKSVTGEPGFFTLVVVSMSFKIILPFFPFWSIKTMRSHVENWGHFRGLKEKINRTSNTSTYPSLIKPAPC